MKKALLLFTLIFALGMTSVAQNSLTVNGYVVDVQNNPVVNHPVTIVDSLSGYSGTVNTNANGYYTSTFAVGTIAVLIIYTPDCNGFMMNHVQMLQQIPPQQTYSHNFTYCSNTFPPVCTSSISAQIGGPNNQVAFLGTHNFAANVFAWDFGDGNTSTQANPIHNYAAQGTYVVTLVASGPSNPAGGSCTTSSSYTVVIANQPANCQAAFVIDTVNSLPGTVVVWNTSVIPGSLNQVSYLWSFGDGTTSTLALPTHTYANPGIYQLCLTIVATGSGMSCTSMHCDTLEVDSNGNLIYKGFAGFQLIVLDPETIGLEDEAVKYVLYPNPATEMVKLEMQANISDVKVRVYNVLGMTVRSLSASELAQGQILEIPVSDLAPGNYWITVESAQGILTERFLKQ